ncbi:CAP domain-containing protein [Polychytrium aggregatum]|uniref:CAP domain-containing protein n=1 Tax=Polychytrium aggregatum TaxID=110093 RepID=UPI0022FDD023|nr:CAP domain-containing protein [Polychytrium aggregatum]KAI9208929.1 CAP domain-containing protein [Polychytrium aggregatum]
MVKLLTVLSTALAFTAAASAEVKHVRKSHHHGVRLQSRADQSDIKYGPHGRPCLNQPGKLVGTPVPAAVANPPRLFVAVSTSAAAPQPTGPVVVVVDAPAPAPQSTDPVVVVVDAPAPAPVETNNFVPQPSETAVVVVVQPSAPAPAPQSTETVVVVVQPSAPAPAPQPTSAPPAPQPAPAPPANNDLASQCLDAHNTARAQYGHAPLTWDNNLSQAAFAYAQTQAATGNGPLEHGGVPAGAGQNLASYGGYPNAFDCHTPVAAWVSESVFYSGQAIDINNPNDFEKWGHFTAVIWPTTKTVGCGYAGDNTLQNEVFWVCDYFPAGNIQGVSAY